MVSEKTNTPGRPLTVGELAARVRRLVEDGIGRVCVEGEVSNLRAPASGHCYFMLKDGAASINAVCFRNTLARQPVFPADGMKLEVTGQLTTYPPRSEYQIVVDSMREAGVGELMRRLQELKERLRAEGLFDLERKRPIPALPRRVGIVTSSTGAALRDVINILGRRTRGLEIYLAPAAVQGEAAPAQIVQALRLLARHGRSEVIIAGRGGGSIEDLWAFNDERVVRAIAASPIPVISAVGHETDTTLSDYAADLRAPTPSAAAELVSAHYAEVLERLDSWRERLGRAEERLVGDLRARLERCSSSWGMRGPRERVGQAMQRLDELEERLGRGAARSVRRRREDHANWARSLERVSPRARLQNLRARMEHLAAMLEARSSALWPEKLAGARSRVATLAQGLSHRAALSVDRQRWRLESASQKLAALSPSAVLARGYSIVTHKHGKIVTSPEQVKLGETVQIRSAGGPWRAAALPPEEDLFDSI
ncbi:MAG: exodeoxyribonuclease VII large subunit [Candidatus Sumerlaeia bacterium]